MKILIIDMDRKMAQYESDCLKTFRYDCDISESGQEGLKMAVDNDYCCIILETDLNSAIDGFLICSQIRKQKNIPIIFISDCGNESAKIRAFGVGADDYITKPFSMPLVLKRIEAVLRRAEQGGQPETAVIRYKGLTLDSDSYTVQDGGGSVSLTTREFEILKLLLENQGRVFTREKLLNSIWGYDYFGDEKIVNTHIKNIRKKLGADYIETIRGVGYKIEKENH